MLVEPTNATLRAIQNGFWLGFIAGAGVSMLLGALLTASLVWSLLHP